MSTNYADEFDMTEPWHFPRQDWLEDVESDPESWGFPGTFSISRLSGHRVPSVDFDAADLNDYVADLLKEHPDADVHRMYIPSEMVPNPVLAEEMDEDPEMRGGYAWVEYGIGRRPFPVPTLLRDENGDLKIVDGNHRIHHWSGNHTHIPAKVVDLDSHKAAVRRALQMGLPVPPDVLADYPDLVQ